MRYYDRLFQPADPEEGGRDPLDDLNPASFERVTGCKIERALAEAPPGTRFQFERLGYFRVDPDSRPGAPVQPDGDTEGQLGQDSQQANGN